MKNLTRFQYILKNLIVFILPMLVLLYFLVKWAIEVEYASELWAYIGTILAIVLILFFSIRHYYRKYDKL